MADKKRRNGLPRPADKKRPQKPKGTTGKWSEGELLKGVTPKMIAGEINWGGPVGKEVW